MAWNATDPWVSTDAWAEHDAPSGGALDRTGAGTLTLFGEAASYQTSANDLTGVGTLTLHGVGESLILGPELGTLWLNDYENPSDFRRFPFLSGLERGLQMEGERRKYGNGRLRSSSQKGQTRDWTVSLATADAADLAWLEAHVDRPIFARDDRGHRIVAIFWEVPVVENAHNDEGTTSFTLSELTGTLEI